MPQDPPITQQTTPQDPPPPPSGGGGASPPPDGGRPRLTRSASDRYLAGVAGGLARHLGVDPLLVRVAFAASVVFGGLGIVAYLALAIFLPSEDGPAPERSRTATIALTALLALAAVVFLGPPAFFAGPGLLGIAILAAVGVLLYRALGGGTQDPGATIARAALALLILVAACGAALAVGLAAALGGGVVIAAGAVVAGVALIAAGLLGGSRWLILPVVAIVAPLAIVAAAGIDLHGGVGSREYRVTRVADLRPSYRLGMGELVLDLEDVALPASGRDVKVSVGIGHAIVRAPAGACVAADARVGVGGAELPLHQQGGVDIAMAQASGPPGALRVHADIGAGDVRVEGDGCS